MCSGARDYACWNAATFDGHGAGPRLAAAVLAVAEGLPAFDDGFRSKARAASVARRSGRAAALARHVRYRFDPLVGFPQWPNGPA